MSTRGLSALSNLDEIVMVNWRITEFIWSDLWVDGVRRFFDIRFVHAVLSTGIFTGSRLAWSAIRLTIWRVSSSLLLWVSD